MYCTVLEAVAVTAINSYNEPLRGYLIVLIYALCMGAGVLFGFSKQKVAAMVVLCTMYGTLRYLTYRDLATLPYLTCTLGANRLVTPKLRWLEIPAWP